MIEASVDETIKMYDNIIKDVILKLKYKSERGFLQMSESQIDDFKDKWIEKLLECRQLIHNQDRLPTKPHQQEPLIKIIKEPPTTIVEPILQKKVKINEEDQMKQEDEEREESDLVVIGEDEDQVKKEENFEQSQVNIKEQESKKEDFEKKKYEKEREKTLFDKIRELNKQKQEQQQEQKQYDSDSNGDHPRHCDVNIYAQKYNLENSSVSRIKPNKQQRANLEYVLIKEFQKEVFLQQAQLSFNFKTNNSRSQ